MESGGNILTLGENLTPVVNQIKKELPAGLEIHQTVNQPEVVKNSINEFVRLLAEAVAIILVVSFASLGMRSGLTVSLCIPLVLAIVFTCMKQLGIDLQKMSLGALIISLGLLVDDAIIVIEMMSVKIEQGWTRYNAACYAYTTCAFPMLTGTLITCAGFIPLGFALGSAAEYCSSIFSVVTISLLASWFVAATATPLLGCRFIKLKPKAAGEPDLYDSRFYRLFKQTLIWCLSHRKTVLAATAGVFFASISLLGLVKQEFFPASTRPELIVQLKLPEGASLKNTEAAAGQFAEKLKNHPQIAYYTYHVGEGAPRFILTFNPTFNKQNFAEFIIVAKDVKARDELRISLNQWLNEALPGVHVYAKVIRNGSPTDYPVMLRVKGYDHDKVREIAGQVAAVMSAHPDTTNVNLNWNEKSKILHLFIDQDKVRNLGITSQTLAAMLQTQLSGTPAAEFRENDKTIDMVFRFDIRDRKYPSQLKDLAIPTGSGSYVALDQIAKIRFEAEDGLIFRRDLKPMIIVQADTKPGVMGADSITHQVYASLAELRASLPLGYSIELDGTAEESLNSAKYLAQPVPAMIIVIMILLMIQLQNISKMVLTLLTAPLGIIGVAAGLFLTGSPMGFVVQLGILALFGIIMRNSVILMDQIDQHPAAGETTWDAIINATVTRFRPIFLTAAAAILGMIPLISSIFWGPMAVAIAFGLFGATILTLIVLPVMYAAWFKAIPNSRPVQTITMTAPNHPE
ncbi:Swarming motility protein SwrC [Sporomusa acidovorans DSM 3132]|uniref:Swarming motility protein SwrC n=1 Tax=Sporomusa acidovorans (strain ATCC 49682 / DSM 3132 / Mol) TaxID=1123286 RepID=A0ABZ3IYQ7_SPOA4|nr:swarming motility protein SwrC [Sporomusa acidovorans DSM 3132]SDE13402.1 Multidrug efflux pump subunit AcrB [Sporomusa acidovorans]